MTFTTHAATPLTNERYPHPPGNDRAWEQVSSPDSGGNPVNFPVAFAADGEAALFQVSGGTPISSSGTIYSQILARRPPGVHPTRELAAAERRAALGLRREDPELGIRSQRRLQPAARAQHLQPRLPGGGRSAAGVAGLTAGRPLRTADRPAGRALGGVLRRLGGRLARGRGAGGGGRTDDAAPL